ncbi:alpha/beta hydrolase [Nonomuraea sp. NPDC005692]|uniref:alpha/beta fold hydrolase n=1 Tax=Nonomuraea sp. NPDC005692 TaxID=3157168 RepID=UPI0033D496F0
MQTFVSYDGTTLAYRAVGSGAPLIVLSGGPGRASSYLGTLGGLERHRTLVLLDTRGTGASELPADLSTVRVDRLVDDVEALRIHLGLDAIDLLGHSAGGGWALLYAAAHPGRLSHLVLVAPSLVAVGLPSDVGTEEVLSSRSKEPWYGTALPAYRGMAAARSFAEAARFRTAFEPLMYGRWDAAAQAHAAADPAERSLPVSDHYYAGYTPDLGVLPALRALPAPVLFLGGAVDLWPTAASLTQAASIFRDATLHVQPNAGHYPWLDDPYHFSGTVAAFLTT